MAVYLIGFAVSCILIKYAEKINSNILSKFFTFLALLIPCLIAGFRADIIGTDVRVYVEPMYLAAKNSVNFFSYLSSRWDNIWTYNYIYDYEIGFSLLVFIITKLFKSLTAVLFIIQVFIIVPIYFGLKNLPKKQSVSFGMLVFYLMDYNPSLNLMRQWIAIAFLVFGFKYLVNKQTLKYFAVVLISMLFHTSAILGFIIYFIYKYINNDKKIRLKKYIINPKTIKILVIISIGLILLISINEVMIILNVLGLSKYSGYINGDLFGLPNQLILRLPVFLLFAINWKNFVKHDQTSYFYLSMMILDLFASQLASINGFSVRISFYFSEYMIFAFPSLCLSNEKKSKNLIITIMLVIYMVMYWFLYFIYLGANETYPYVLLF